MSYTQAAVNRSIIKLRNFISSLHGDDFSIGSSNRIGLMQMVLARDDGIDIGKLRSYIPLRPHTVYVYRIIFIFVPYLHRDLHSAVCICRRIGNNPIYCW